MTMVLQATTEGKGLELQGQFEALWGFVQQAVQTGLPVHEVEQGLFKRLLQLGYQLQGQFFALLGDGDQGETASTAEGRVLRRLPQPHRRAYQSIFGRFELERVVYGTREGQRIEYVPLDARLSLPAGTFSYSLQGWDQALAVESPYGQVNAVLTRILGLEQSVASLEQMTRTLAASVEGYWEAQPPPPVAGAGQVLVISADHKGVPLRKPTDAPAICAHDPRRGPKPGRKKLATVGAVYEIEPYRRTPQQVLEALFRDPAAGPAPPATPPRPTPQHKRVRATLRRCETDSAGQASAEILAWLAQEALERDPERQRPRVVLMDGETGLWAKAARELGEATSWVEILDLLHATGYLWEAVHLFHASGTEAALKMMKVFVWVLLNGQSEALLIWLEDLADQAGLSSAKRERLTKICNYLCHNQDRLHYDQYLAAGYPIASGVIEGACRHVVKDRLERAGMHWTIAGAQALLQLRCVALNGEWEDFMHYHIQQETARLYPHAELADPAAWPLPKAA